MKRCIPLFALLRLCYGGDTIDPKDLVRRAGMTMQSDWAAAPGFAFVQRDFTASKGVITRKTHQVFTISGSDYYMPIAINDEFLPGDQEERELRRLQEEVDRRSHETTKEVRRRSEQYYKAREQNGVLLLEFTKAFDFTLKSPLEFTHSPPEEQFHGAGCPTGITTITCSPLVNFTASFTDAGSIPPVTTAPSPRATASSNRFSLARPAS